MSISPKFTIDVPNKIATLEIFIGQEFVTKYTYETSAFTLQERPNIDVITKENLSSNVTGIKEWVRFIGKFLAPQPLLREEFETEMKKNNGVLTAKIESSGEKISEIEFLVSTKEKVEK